MPKLEVSIYPDTSTARMELAAFLRKHDAAPHRVGWERRMAFWWDQNPATGENHERGRWVHSDGQLVGFGGSIPALYAWQGSPLTALLATTLCVDERFPKAAALMFLKQREVARHHLIVHTTPNRRVQEALLAMGSCAEKTVARHFFAAGAASRLRGRSWWPSLPTRKRLTIDPAEVTAVVRPFRRTDRIEKWITLEYLRWFCSSPGRKHHFLGAVNAEGVLSSYLLATPRAIKGLQSWDMLEAFTTEDDEAELHALIGMLVKEPGLLPGGASLVSATAFPGDHVWDRAPALLRRRQHVCHFFLMPERLRDAPKHTVMGEGDLGL